jgi:hypothetical protein
MRYFFILFMLCCIKIAAQDTLYTKSITGVGNRNLSVTNQVYANGKVVFFVSNSGDSVVAPDMKMVIMDTCGNVEKINIIPLEGHWGIEFFGGANTTLLYTMDNKFLLSGYQPINSTGSSNQTFLFRVDWNGKIELNEKIPRKGQVQWVYQLLETKDAYYVGGFRRGFDVLEFIPFVVRVGKDNKNKWYANTTYPLEMRVIKDTLYILYGSAVNKRHALTGEEFDAPVHPLAVTGIELNRFINDSTILNFGTYNYIDSSNNNKSHNYLFFVKTNKNFLRIGDNVLIPNMMKEQDEYIYNIYIDPSDGSAILTTFPREWNKYNYLFLRKFDHNGKLLWARTDKIEHRGVAEIYDINVGCLILPSSNIIDLLYSQTKYITNNPDVLNEIRVAKFDKNGKEILKECSILALSETNDRQDKLKVFPNPFSETLNIVINSPNEEQNNYHFQLLDIHGRILKTAQFQGNSFVLQRDDLGAGFYFFQIMNKNKLIGNGKIVVE